MRHRQSCRLGTCEAAVAAIHQSDDAVGIGKRHIAHPHRVAYPQVGVIQQTHRPSDEHRCRVPALGARIALQGVPCRAQQPCQCRAIGVGQRCAPLAVGFSKSNGIDVSLADLRAHAKVQLWHGISWIKYRPAVALGQQIDQAVTSNNHHHGADGMGSHHWRVHPCHHLAVDKNGAVAGTTHRVVTAHREQAFAVADGGNRCGMPRHLQGIFAFAQILR